MRFAHFAAFTLALGLVTRVAQGQTEEELASARKLFTEAMQDEESRRYDVALDKFQRVQKVRDTTNVRFRIGACFEALGKLKAAKLAYDSAAALGATDTASGDVVRAAREKAAELDPVLPRLTLTIPPDAPKDLDVRVDDSPIPREALREAIALDPGDHSILATGTGVNPFRTQMKLTRGARLTLTVTFVKTGSSEKVPRLGESKRSSAVPAIVVLGSGALLLGGAGVVALMQRSDVSELSTLCAPHCPTTQPQYAYDLRSRALILRNVAATLGITGGLATLVGLYLLIDRAATPPPVLPEVTTSGATVTWTGRF